MVSKNMGKAKIRLNGEDKIINQNKLDSYNVTFTFSIVSKWNKPTTADAKRIWYYFLGPTSIVL